MCKFSAEILKEIISIGFKPHLIITKSKSSFNSDFFDLSKISNQYNLRSVYTDDINSQDMINIVKEIEPDLIFCFGWSSLIKKKILDIPKVGTIGFTLL